MKTIASAFISLFVLFQLNAQDFPKWMNFTGDDGVNSVQFVGDTIWVGSNGGISLVNYTDGSLIHNFNSANSAMKGNTVNELVASTDGRAWFLSPQFSVNNPNQYIYDYGLNLQYFNGQEIVPPASNMEVLDSSANKKSLGLTSNEDVFFVENEEKLWRLSDLTLTEIALPEGYPIIKNLFVDEQDGLLVSLSSDTTFLRIGYYKDNTWTIYRPETFGNDILYTKFIDQVKTGPDGNLYCTACNSVYSDCFFFRFDYENWTYLMTVDSDFSSFVWNPEGVLYFYNTILDRINEVIDWSIAIVNSYEVGLGNLTVLPREILRWEDDNTLWAIGQDDKLYKFLAIHNTSTNSNYYTDSGTLLHTRNSPLTTNNIVNFGVNTQFKKFIVTNDALITAFDGITWEEVHFDTFTYTYNTNDLRLYTNNSGQTFFHPGGQRFLVHDSISLNEYHISNYLTYLPFFDNDGNLLYNSGNHSNFVRLTTSGEFTETAIPSRGSTVADQMDSQGRIWIYNGYYLVDKPQYYDGIWNNVYLPPGIFSNFFLGDPKPFVDSEDNAWFLTNDGSWLKYQINLQEWEIIDIPDSVHTGGFTSDQTWIKEDSKGNIWILSSENGLIKYTGADWTYFRPDNSGLSGLLYTDFDIDKLDNLWISTRNGLTVFNEEGIRTLGNTPFYRLSGRVYFDLDNDAVFNDSVDMHYADAPVFVRPYENLLFANETGRYGVNLLEGGYEVEVLPPDYWSVADANPLPVNIDGGDLLEIDVRLLPDTIVNAGEIYLTGNPTRCNQIVSYYLHAKNTGTTIIDGRIEITPAMLGSIVSTSTPLTFDPMNAKYYLEFEGLNPFQTIDVEIRYQVPNFMFIGEILDWAAKLQVLNNGDYVDLDSIQFAQELRCSYDPNDKLVQSEGPNIGQESLIADKLIYTIRFQNTGNDVAYKVEIIDTLDVQFDPATLRIIQSSHTMETYVEEGGIIHFVFDDIFLPDSISNEPQSHGFVQYTILPDEELAPPLTLSNTAFIYFDSNPAIQTNTTSNTLLLAFPPNNVSTVRTESFKVLVYPNPATEEVFVQVATEESAFISFKVAVFTLDGRLVETKALPTPNNITVLDLSALSSGCYVLRVESARGVVSKRLIKFQLIQL